ncbi:PAAR domain-containing protein [Pseudomonas lijiangensis]|uniref:PAAR domain-containing protein n=1 Tax=Pseudomonas lijiangensis TaxID=2995658 RepID=A0ABX8HJG9_9PSED|nr:PAAR domain-containing protein [Pseudomonas lijiangensis]MBX8518783.1 PAAR domain-containing protein [Pseudomonas cichorii]MBX8498610.1 PAAR domain-containing protein [Pseudomonas lijiangensis]MBX8503517.1 PAAR domain-containing protein [Pseudomonas lijiangensis]MBX8568681.1 PAAR domain-containing protein [Pseudomonas cichorii]QWU80901.1 PAAR domain-containing protein [Pseudomonas lijiangensis]
MSGKPAARVSDPTACPVSGHGTNPIAAGSGDVFFDGLPAARQGDASACGGAMVGDLATTVLINGKPAATVGSVGSHGNKVTAGSGTVIIGNSHTPAPFVAPEPVVIPGVFNRTFEFQTANGQPVSSLNYRMISESGIEKAGSSSTAGATGCLSTGKQSEIVTIYVASE